MDYGYGYQNGRHRAYRFSTNSFPLEDQKILVQALINNFSIIQKDHYYNANYRLYIRAESTNRFVDLIRPYLHPCFDYKL